MLRELVAAVGGALFFGNVLALARRRRQRAEGEATDLERAPVIRTLVYAVIGFVVMLAGIGALVAG